MEEPRLELPKQGSDAPFIEQVSKIKVTLNAKQDPQWEVSIVEGADPVEVAKMRELALEQHRILMHELLGQ
jgi:hypothetical protein